MHAENHVLIIVQNLPVPLDRRVWLECQALVEKGFLVSVICPKGPGDPPREEIDGVRIYKYRPAPQASGLAGYILEFAYSWLRTAWLSVVVWRRMPFKIIQACNPPDTYWLLARIWRLVPRRQVKFVFDQHDLNPELFESRFGKPDSVRERLEYRGLLWLERMSYRTADRVVSTNESYRTKAVVRGGRRAEDVTVVRSGPNTEQMRPIYPDPAIRGNAEFLLAYIGIMGPQDGVHIVLDVMDELINRRGRRDVHAVLLGFGDCLESLKSRCTELNLDGWVTFTGRANREMIAAYLSAADVGLCPDLNTPLNNISTMNKTMEYMAHALPSVSFDLVETRVSGAETVLYVPSGDVMAFTDAVERLLEDRDLRVRMGLGARRRVVQSLDWRSQSGPYVQVFSDLVGLNRSSEEPSVAAEITEPGPGVDRLGRTYVDVSDENELARFIIERRPSGSSPN